MYIAKENVLRSALASKLAYIDNPMITKVSMTRQLHGNNFTRTRIIENKDTGAHAYVWNSGERSTMVSFRGSHDINDLLSFLNMKKKRLNIRDHSVYIHNGIFNMFESIENDLTDHILNRPKLEDRSITFCGHSMGGAIAMVAAAYYGSLTGDKTTIACHSFGSPKVGDKSFVEWHKKHVDESFNITDKNDIVCSFPFMLGYDTLPRVVISNGSSDLFRSHDLDTYYNVLTNMCQKR